MNTNRKCECHCHQIQAIECIKCFRNHISPTTNEVRESDYETMKASAEKLTDEQREQLKQVFEKVTITSAGYVDQHLGATGIKHADMIDIRTCKSGHTTVGIGFEDGCPECEEPWVEPSVVEGWEERFRIKFARAVSSGGFLTNEAKRIDDFYPDREAIVDFIRSERAIHEKEIRAKLKEMNTKEVMEWIYQQ